MANKSLTSLQSAHQLSLDLDLDDAGQKDLKDGEVKRSVIFPKNIPNLIHNMCKGVKILEFIIPKIKKTNEINKDHIIKSSLLIKG